MPTVTGHGLQKRKPADFVHEPSEIAHLSNKDTILGNRRRAEAQSAQAGEWMAKLDGLQATAWPAISQN